MSSPIVNMSSSSTFFPNTQSSIVPNESPSTPSSYISLLDTSQSPDAPVLSLPQRSTLGWIHTFDTIRQWSTRTIKFTRQVLQERTGQCIRTQDTELEKNIEVFRETKRHYEQLLKEARQMSIHFAGILQTQRSLSQSFTELQRMTTTSIELTNQFARNGHCQKTLASNGDALLNSINIFVEALQTLVTKTMEDTLMTVKAYEKSRIEYDAYRYDYELVLSRNHTGGVTLSNSEEHIERQYYHFKDRYEKLKANLIVKIKLLDDNRIKVMQQQLILFHNAIANYFLSIQKQFNYEK
ncbi:unnamed protein product [Adineta steineri]|uniref:AH domain-containing protein n=1 Tax=Adineta steineri TaxID=433720 RepID=A0A814XVB3_9BILA|nr:unnamed protein product [Adineta steineri]CAF1513431.1 unnamed protein product [Adineta steineri]